MTTSAQSAAQSVRPIKLGINGFGRMGRLTLRALLSSSLPSETPIQVVKINDPAGNAEALAHLLNFDSVHGRWPLEARSEGERIIIDDLNKNSALNHDITCSQDKAIEAGDWSECDMVLEASGKFKSKAKLQAYFDQGVKKVVVTAPVKEEGVLDLVMGVNDDLYDPDQFNIVTAASCTTNCLAPAVKVIHEKIGIAHGSMTTIHDITNTQSILDTPHKDLRRARASGMSLIPTTTGSATAITHIFPELKGKLNGHAIRVPLANASITDCVFELTRPTTVEEVNALLKDASETYLKDILGFEERPLVSIDYRTDPRSSIVDALSTMVVNDTQLKLYLWYDNEWGYANRSAELVKKVIRLGL